MNLFQFLIPRENVSGLAVGQDVLRLSYVAKSASGYKIQAASEVELPEGTIEGGVLKKPKVLTAAAAKLLKQARPRPIKFPYVVASLPQSNTYSQIITFPPLPPERIAEAVSMNAALTLPLPLSEVYLDWQIVEETTERLAVLVSLVPKAIADPYLAAFKEAKLELVALEMPSFSLGRALKLPPRGLSLLLKEGVQGILAVAYDGGVPLFTRQVPWIELGFEAARGAPALAQVSDVLGHEAKRLHDYITFEHPGRSWQGVVLLSSRVQAPALAKAMAEASGLTVSLAEAAVAGLPTDDWLASAGAGVRGLIPRSEDVINSLLPVGTEALYERQKAISFFNTIRSVLLVVLGLYVAVYLGAFILLGWLNTSLGQQVEQRSRLPLPPETAELESAAREFNSRVNELKALPMPPPVLRSSYVKDMATFATAGVTFTRVMIPEGNDPTVTVQGIAQTRESLVVFKRQLETKPGVSGLKMPIANLALKESIPFSVVFTLKPQ